MGRLGAVGADTVQHDLVPGHSETIRSQAGGIVDAALDLVDLAAVFALEVVVVAVVPLGGLVTGGLARQFDRMEFAVVEHELDSPINSRQTNARNILLGTIEDFLWAQGPVCVGKDRADGAALACISCHLRQFMPLGLASAR